jgi:uncharacterized protein YqjF (DUF2071 family)
MSGRQPEERVARPASYQRWSSLTFLHFAFEPDVIQARLPAGLHVDTLDGAAWVSMTPFLMDFRVAGLPPLPTMSTFPETNLRTYVRGPDGRDGIWFFSLEAGSLPVVLAASTFYRVPYRWARMTIEQGETVRYRSRRRHGAPAGHDIEVRVGPAIDEPQALDNWLIGRWRGWTTIAGRSCAVAVHHPPWPLHEATLVRFEESLFEVNGLHRPAAPPLVRFSPGTDVRLGIPRPAPKERPTTCARRSTLCPWSSKATGTPQ